MNSLNLMMLIYNLVLVVVNGGFGVTVIEKLFWFVISLVSMLFRLAVRLLKSEKQIVASKITGKAFTRKSVKYEEVEDDEDTDEDE